MEINYNQMLDIAKEVSKNAYAPFSKFVVGACVQGGSGEYYSGCNVENSSFGLTICAERSAICKAVSNGEKEITAVAIYSPNAEDCLPCGACRQVIFEFATKEISIITEKDGAPKVVTIENLLPYGFKL